MDNQLLIVIILSLLGRKVPQKICRRSSPARVWRQRQAVHREGVRRSAALSGSQEGLFLKLSSFVSKLDLVGTAIRNVDLLLLTSPSSSSTKKYQVVPSSSSMVETTGLISQTPRNDEHYTVISWHQGASCFCLRPMAEDQGIT